MRARALAPLVLCACAACASAATPPSRPSTRPVAPALPWHLRGVLELPAAPGPHPGVVLLPGAGGWAPRYQNLARALADSGFAALALDYYGLEGPPTSAAELVPKTALWRRHIRDAVGLLRSSAAKDRPVALVGFSRGAFLAIMVANRTPGVAAVVDYFGGAQIDPDSLRAQMRAFPPLLILHGDADRIVPVAEAYRLQDEVERRGGTVEVHIYPGGDHGLTDPATLRDAFGRTVAFLRRRLGG